jgi:hypothetical protein
MLQKLVATNVKKTNKEIKVWVKSHKDLIIIEQKYNNIKYYNMKIPILNFLLTT